MSEAPARPTPPTVVDIDSVETIQAGDLLARVKQMHDEDARLLSATCLDAGDTFEVYYHFDKKLDMHHLLVSLPRDEEIPSISGIYLAAFVVENEMKELFGIQITNIAIDYHGRLFLTEDSEPTPMAKPRAIS